MIWFEIFQFGVSFLFLFALKPKYSHLQMVFCLTVVIAKDVLLELMVAHLSFCSVFDFSGHYFSLICHCQILIILMSLTQFILRFIQCCWVNHSQSRVVLWYHFVYFLLYFSFSTNLFSLLPFFIPLFAVFIFCSIILSVYLFT